jgi:hypothetical protein
MPIGLNDMIRIRHGRHEKANNLLVAPHCRLTVDYVSGDLLDFCDFRSFSGTFGFTFYMLAGPLGRYLGT